MMQLNIYLDNDDVIVRVLPPNFSLFCDSLLEIQQKIAKREISISKVCIVETKSPIPVLFRPYCTNICAKIAHVPQSSPTSLLRKEIVSYAKHLQNGFGSFTSIYSKHCNFYIGSLNQNTLCRGASNCEQILDIVPHIFEKEFMNSICIHNIVFSGALQHKIHLQNGSFVQILKEKFHCNVLSHTSFQDHQFFTNSLQLDFSKNPDSADCNLPASDIQQVLHKNPYIQKKSGDKRSLDDMQDALSIADCILAANCNLQLISKLQIKSIRLNMCRSGVINFFIALKCGIVMEIGSEKLFAQLCEYILLLLNEFC
jgi:hypothetical protein